MMSLRFVTPRAYPASRARTRAGDLWRRTPPHESLTPGDGKRPAKTPESRVHNWGGVHASPGFGPPLGAGRSGARRCSDALRRLLETAAPGTFLLGVARWG